MAERHVQSRKSLNAARRLNRATVRAAVDIVTQMGRVTVFTFNGLSDARQHVAVRYPRPPGESDAAPLVRVHSACLTGDIFGSRRCDCGAQLDEARRLCVAHGGYILYMDQEGRGIGLYAKLDAYVLQGLGLDTFAANEALGHPRDARDFAVAAQMLEALDIRQVRLLTNNPEKVDALRRARIAVDTVSTGVFVHEDNVAYMKAKRDITGHSLGLNSRRKGTAA